MVEVHQAEASEAEPPTSRAAVERESPQAQTTEAGEISSAADVPHRRRSSGRPARVQRERLQREAVVLPQRVAFLFVAPFRAVRFPQEIRDLRESAEDARDAADNRPFPNGGKAYKAEPPFFCLLRIILPKFYHFHLHFSKKVVYYIYKTKKYQIKKTNHRKTGDLQ